MPRQIITTPEAPKSPLYRQGIRAGTSLFVSGIVGIDASTKSLAGPTIQDQTRQALKNCEGWQTWAVGAKSAFAANSWNPTTPTRRRSRKVAHLVADVPSLLTRSTSAWPLDGDVNHLSPAAPRAGWVASATRGLPRPSSTAMWSRGPARQRRRPGTGTTL